MKEILFIVIAVSSIAMAVRLCIGGWRNAPADALGFVYLLQTVATRAQTDRLPGHLHLTSLISFIVIGIALLRWPPVERRKASRRLETCLVCGFWLLQLFLTNTVASNGLRSLLEVAVVAIPVAMVARYIDRSGVIRLMQWLVWTALVQCGCALVEIWRGKPVWGYAKNASGTADFVQSNNIVPTSIPRLEGATGHSILFGAVMVFGCVGLVFWRTRPVRHRVVLAVPLVGFLLLSGSRGAVLTLLALVAYWMLSPQVRISFGARIIGGITFLAIGYAAYSLIAEIVGEWQETGSYTNRSNALKSLENLLGMDTHSVLLGHGWSSIPSLFDSNILRQTNELRVVDNQYVSTVATGGLVSLLVLVLIAVVGWRTGQVINRSLLLVIFIGCAFFDSLFWGPMIVMFSAAAGIGVRNGVKDESAVADPTAVVALQLDKVPTR